MEFRSWCHQGAAPAGSRCSSVGFAETRDVTCEIGDILSPRLSSVARDPQIATGTWCCPNSHRFYYICPGEGLGEQGQLFEPRLLGRGFTTHPYRLISDESA